ncbi:MAG TPA: hypothetical protein VGQ17_02715 [Gemmatimonadales bacterium]|jgi:hypothetical protein|nr:hypothetical protein [Gemmatimonadales bacterium]
MMRAAAGVMLLALLAGEDLPAQESAAGKTGRRTLMPREPATEGDDQA